eukprot:TRINITY_DN25376_c0_g1_i2.p1 TRINITY_DN25376_c0_g1~~TRINITY_DN25376_c0_g1_i2.p1  ORF type:complete len:249 (+),score=51.32 TRINITY_DN25376_c0_g1_i2:150-896(+)
MRQRAAWLYTKTVVLKHEHLRLSTQLREVQDEIDRSNAALIQQMQKANELRFQIGYLSEGEIEWRIAALDFEHQISVQSITAEKALLAEIRDLKQKKKQCVSCGRLLAQADIYWRRLFADHQLLLEQRQYLREALLDCEPLGCSDCLAKDNGGQYEFHNVPHGLSESDFAWLEEEEEREHDLWAWDLGYELSGPGFHASIVRENHAPHGRRFKSSEKRSRAKAAQGHRCKHRPRGGRRKASERMVSAI